MSKTIKNSFHNKLKYELFLQAYQRASKNKKNRLEVIRFNFHLEQSLINLIDDIRNNKYKVSNYHEFKIYEPKERVIRKLPFVERIVHQWYIHEFIKPFFVPRFIYDSYACLDGKGIYKAINRLQIYMRKMTYHYGKYYIIKGDIKGFFDHIDKDILFKIMSKYISDKRLLHFTYKLIYENSNKYGLPIGNYTSQYFANIYLNELDYYVKHELKQQYYIRYMDDFIILLENKEKAKGVFKLIDNFVNNYLNLSLNKKSKYYPSYLTTNFLGFKIYNYNIYLNNKNKTKIHKIIKLYNKGYINNKQIASYTSLLKHSNNKYLLNHLINHNY